MWLDEGNDLIRSCAQLSSVLGLQKSFSTSDITQLPNTRLYGSSLGHALSSNTSHLRQTISELALNSLQLGYMLDSSRLDHTSRSCSTWVAVGELASTSQLPSPHGGPVVNVGTNNNTSSSQQQLTAPNANIPSQPTFTAVDLLLSVNKSVRRNYIRRRLLTTYRAIERLSQSEFNLNSIELEAAAVAATGRPARDFRGSSVAGAVNAAAAAVAAAHANDPGPKELIVPTTISNTKDTEAATTTATENKENDGAAAAQAAPPVKTQSAASTVPQLMNKLNINNRNLTIHDIEKERGRPLSKYDRNMMIFNWLHSLDETSTVEEYNNMM